MSWEQQKERIRAERFAAMKAKLASREATIRSIGPLVLVLERRSERLAAKVADLEAQLERERQGPFAEAMRWKQILLEVGAKYGFSIEEMTSIRRHKPLVAARHEAMWRMKNETNMSFPAIGRRMGRDHTTIMHGIRCHERSLSEAQGMAVAAE